MAKHLDFYNENQTLSYPFEEGYSEDRIPRELFVGMALSVPDSFSLPFYIKDITIGVRSIAFNIVDNNGSIVGVASGAIQDSSMMGGYQNLFFNGLDNSMSGAIVINKEFFYEFNRSNIGNFSFAPEETRIQESVVSFYDDNRVTSIGVDGFDDVLTGDITLKFEGGMKIVVQEDNINEILFSIEVPESYTPECGGRCFANECDPVAIRTINEIQPDVDGNFLLTGDGITSASTPRDGVIQIETPQVSINDICQNKTSPSPGEPGQPGPKGPQGEQGEVITNGCLPFQEDQDAITEANCETTVPFTEDLFDELP